MSATCVFADDVGITKARLIQKSEKSYVVEADVTQALVWAIKQPIFPDRFQVSELEYITQSGWIIIQATATTDGEPLSPHDEILLPWMRNGVAISVQWLDGSLQRGLFLRSLEGIRVEMSVLIKSVKSLREICGEHFLAGLQHLTFKWVHILFAGILVLLVGFPQVFRCLLFYSFGQAFSLVLADFGLPGFELLYVGILGMVLVFLMAVSVARNKPAKEFLPLLFFFGLLHGLAYAQELSALDLEFAQKLPALFMFNIALDIGHFAMAGLFLGAAYLFGKMMQIKKLAAYGFGTLAIALLCLLFQEEVVTGKTDVLQYNTSRIATQYSLPVSQKSQTGGNRPRGTRRMTSPVMSYLSVEPFEVRQEILVQGRAAVRFLGVNDTGMGSIPVESLELVKQGLLSAVQKANPILIDGESVEPVLTRADFVTLGPAGVIVREKPVAESLDNGIIGITMVYNTPDLADRIEIDWRLFSDSVQKIEATATDPFGGATMILSPADNKLQWKSRLSGYQVPVIEKIVVEKQKLPVISALVFLCVFVVFLFSMKRRKVLVGQPVLLSVAALGFVFYPFARFPVDLPFVSQWKPSAERTATILDGLLTNVYRSFDVRVESDVYDRLALSVTGDQLTNIYLENRQSLELENRGGARANVDEVEILSINKVKAAKGEGFIADAAWTVSGSVNHFGHTHYRCNQYHALVTFVTHDDSWKIKDIELIDEERIL